ncbi:hypothetical protein [Leptolyngbya iicbica]|uniref:Thiol-disulfide isomerase n=2 Tax=Cyanophyceae TaxID=3028117 RepID=A0A4Q7E4T1_9CYAN|nr:hypothetical protein [Leptolyngbya sp. LK]RZM77137.1 hypothetical protein DYY88_15915 [Leptolyngbya sp. LK]
MVIFQMKISEVLQGEFALRPLNLLLVFQVNCPGCFMYALPLAARLHDQYGDRVNILGLSTAFEDFDLNTADNTRRLLTTGEVVGMTKLHLAQQGQTAYTVPMRFPVAFDAPDGQTPGDAVESSSVPKLVSAGYTFRSNHLRGTPSWILLDESSRIWAQWFGHRSESAVELMLQQALAANSVHTFHEQSV